MCVWKDHCDNARKADDDISLVYNTRVETRKKLRAAGLNTIEKLANSKLEDKVSQGRKKERMIIAEIT